MTTRPKRLTTTFYAGAALSLALGAALLATSLPARAADDVPFESKVFRGILEGLGLRKDGEACGLHLKSLLRLKNLILQA